MSPGDAFTNAAGADLQTIALLAAALVAGAIFLWAGWAVLSVYLGWSRERVDLPTFQRAMGRIVLLTVVILWIVL